MAIQNLGKEPSDGKSKVPRQRKVCQHCGKVHNLHKNVASGCRFAKYVKGQISTSSTSSKMAKRTTSSTSDQSSESEEEENGDDDPPGITDDGSRSVSLYSPSKSSDDEDDSPPTSPSRQNIINEYWNEDSASVGESTDSFHDDSSYTSSVDDDLMPDLYDSSDESDEDQEANPDSDVDEDVPWTEVDLVGPRTGKFGSEPPAFPRYTPKERPGPNYLHPATSFPIDFFHLYLDTSIMEQFVVNTNLCGETLSIPKSKRSNGPNKGRWKATTIAELYRLFGVFLHMGMKRQPTMRSYWSTDPRYSDSFVKKCFTRDRFETLKRVLHVVNPRAFTKAQLKQKHKDDPFWRVSPYLDHLCHRYQLYFVCGQDIDIDEMCIGFKGRHVARCYNPNKPDKWHLKAFCLNDSSTGYLHRFYMYQGFTFNFFSKGPNKGR